MLNLRVNASFEYYCSGMVIFDLENFKNWEKAYIKPKSIPLWLLIIGLALASLIAVMSPLLIFH